MRTEQVTSVERCKDGFIQNPDDWSPELARQLAGEWDGLEFTEELLDLLLFMREHYFEHHVTPDVREATQYLMSRGLDKKAAKKRLFELFPHGYMQQGCQLAGLRRPTAWCVG